MTNIGHSGFSSLRLGASRLVTTTGCRRSVYSANRQHDACGGSSNDLKTTVPNPRGEARRKGARNRPAAWQGGRAGRLRSTEVGVRRQVWEQTSCVVAENSQPEGSLGG